MFPFIIIHYHKDAQGNTTRQGWMGVQSLEWQKFGAENMWHQFLKILHNLIQNCHIVGQEQL